MQGARQAPLLVQGYKGQTQSLGPVDPAGGGPQRGPNPSPEHKDLLQERVVLRGQVAVV